MVRLKDVARRAQVSVATTSRVLNGSAFVSDALRDSVLAAARELNYTPDGIARSMSTRRTSTLGLVVADITSPSITKLVRAVEDTGHKHGYSVLLCNSDEDPAKERSYLTTLREHRVAGILLVVSSSETAHVERIVAAGSKLVLLDRYIPGLQVPTVQVDNYGGVFQATEYLLRLGHRRIAMAIGDLAVSTARERLAGFEAALAAAGVPLDPDLLIPAGLTEQGGYQTALRLLTLAPMPTAIISWSDLSTTGLLIALREHTLRIPEDISVIGFDDLPYFGFLEHPLTTIAQPIYAMGQRACEILLRLIRGESDFASEEGHLRLPTELIIRESCRCVARSALCEDQYASCDRSHSLSNPS
jgi:LacI family transcriptional regulator